jgi:hypothetical protein
MNEQERNALGSRLWDEIAGEVKDGVECPCCRQYVKMYVRKLNSGMVLFLIRLYKADRRAPGGTFNVRDLLPATSKVSTDGAYLPLWGLAEVPAKGYYRITSSGRLFVQNMLRVQQHVVLLCGRFLGFRGKAISIQDACRDRFDLEELLKS